MTQIPRGWYKCQNKQIIDLWNKVCNRAIEKGVINYTPEVWMFKSSKTWGWARYDVKIRRTQQGYYHTWNYNENKKPIVGLNEAFLQKPEVSLQCMLHELAHVVVYERNKRLGYAFEKHSGTWRNAYYNLAKEYGFGYYQMTRCNDYSELGIEKAAKVEYKYELYCPVCGATWKYKTRCAAVNNPHRYKCHKCHEYLESREIK